MTITNIEVQFNPAIQATRLSPKAAQHLSGINATPIDIGDFSDLTIYTGIVSFVFKGLPSGIAHESLEFLLPDTRTDGGPLRLDIDAFHTASATLALVSFAFDGVVEDALWAADGSGASLDNLDSGTGTANIRVVASLAVRGLNGVILRACCSAYVSTRSGAIVVA